MKIKKSIKFENQKPKILGTGLIALDIVLSKENNFSFVQTGGTCGNVLTILSFFDWDSFPVARLSDDFASQKVIEDLMRWNVSLDFATTEQGVSTPVIIQTISKHKSGQIKHKFSFNCPNCGAWLPSYKPVLAKAAKSISENLDDNISVFFFDRVSRASLILAKACAEKGAVIVFEPISISDPKLFEEALALTHILKYSHERFPVSPIDQFNTKNSLIEIQTQGASGLQYRTSLFNQNFQQWNFLESYEVNNIKDTAGAGDWCTAGIIDLLCKDGISGLKNSTKSLFLESLNFGQLLGSWACQFEGARGGMYKFNEQDYKLKFLDIIKHKYKDSVLKKSIKNVNSDVNSKSTAINEGLLNQNIFCQSSNSSKQICCF